VLTEPYRLRAGDALYFLHIPKTGGVTLGTLLEERFPRPAICPVRQLDDLWRQPPAAYDPFRLFWGHFGLYLPAFLQRRLLTVTLLRNPIEQVMSFYQYVRHDPSHYLHHPVATRRMSLDDFVRHPAIVPHIWNPQVHALTWDAGLVSWDPAGVELAGRGVVPDPLLVNLARQRLEQFAFVGLTERMADSLRLLCHLFEWEEFPAVPRLNASARPSQANALPDETRYAIQEVTELDAELYRYAQRIFDARFQQFEEGQRDKKRGLLRPWLARR
jgi:hypothetical protein